MGASSGLEAAGLDIDDQFAQLHYNEVIRELAEEHETLFVDEDEIPTQESEGGLLGANDFVDLAHPTLGTPQRIVRAIADTLFERGLPVDRVRWRRGAYADVDPERLRAGVIP